MFSNIKNKNISKNSEELAKEYLKCKQNPFYWIYNYAYLYITGGRVKITPDNLHPKMKRVIRSIYRYRKVVLMASRQLGKSSTAALLISWAAIFYPGIRCSIANMKKSAAINNMEAIKFIILNCPSWMVTDKPFKTKSEIQSYVNLFNNSRIEVFYPATVHDPSTLARSLTVPILYIDEAAFINHMDSIYGSAQQTLSKAREQAEKNGYPWFLLVTSTPNGINGDGEWFYKRWSNAVDSDLLFEITKSTENSYVEEWKQNVDLDEIINDPNKNTFIKVKYHWSEDPSKDDKWYEEQKKELDNERMVNQELDLIFVGGKNCIFSDSTLSSMKPGKILSQEMFSNPIFHMDVYKNPKELNPLDYYIISADTAISIEDSGSYNAVEVFSFKNFDQIAEVQVRFGSFKLYSLALHRIFQWLYQKVGDRIILVIENNTIGTATIEGLINPPISDEFNYYPYLFKDDPGKDKIGIYTSGMTKQLMVGCLMEVIKDDPTVFKSKQLINQFGSIERGTTGTIKTNGPSDLFMSTCFAAYARKSKAVEIMPLVSFTDKQIQSQVFNSFKTVADLSTNKSFLNEKNNQLGSATEDANMLNFYNVENDDDFDMNSVISFFGSM